MTETEFDQLIKPDRYQVFLFASPIPIPLNFFVHTWLVIADHGKVSRWDVWERKNRCPTSWGYVHLNLFQPWTGIRMFPFGRRKKFASKLLGSIEGENGSIAQRMIMFIEKNAREYEFSHRYWYFPGPNSNSFIQWILSYFPESGLRLPYSAAGKKFISFAKHKILPTIKNEISHIHEKSSPLS